MQTFLDDVQRMAWSYWNRRSTDRPCERDGDPSNAATTDLASCPSPSAASSCSPNSDGVYSINAVPQFGVTNDFIREGYRPPLNYRKCFWSAFAWNNETLNIWTHVLAMLIFGVQMLRFNWVILPELQAAASYPVFSTSPSTSSPVSPWLPFVGASSSSSSSFPAAAMTSSVTFVWNASLICFAVCMGFSAGFHLFSCHSLEVSTRWLGLDFMGMSVATLGCYLSGIFCAFACHPFWLHLYLSAVVGILLLILALPVFLADYWDPDWVWIRAAIQISAVSFGVVPILHAIGIEGGFFSPFSSLFLRGVFDLYFYGALSFFFYASKLPERFLPGQFDFFGQSHQLWHLMIFYTLYNWHHRTLEMLEFRFRRPCEEGPLP